MTDLRARLTAIAGPAAAEQIIELLDEEAATRCTDTDCVRWWPHSRLAQHRWRHNASAPRTRSLIGWRCFTCGQPTWRRIHRPGRQP